MKCIQCLSKYSARDAYDHVCAFCENCERFVDPRFHVCGLTTCLVCNLPYRRGRHKCSPFAAFRENQARFAMGHTFLVPPNWDPKEYKRFFEFWGSKPGNRHEGIFQDRFRSREWQFATFLDYYDEWETGQLTTQSEVNSSIYSSMSKCQAKGCFAEVKGKTPSDVANWHKQHKSACPMTKEQAQKVADRPPRTKGKAKAASSGSAQASQPAQKKTAPASNASGSGSRNDVAVFSNPYAVKMMDLHQMANVRFSASKIHDIAAKFDGQIGKVDFSKIQAGGFLSLRPFAVECAVRQIEKGSQYQVAYLAIDELQDDAPTSFDELWAYALGHGTAVQNTSQVITCTLPLINGKPPKQGAIYYGARSVPGVIGAVVTDPKKICVQCQVRKWSMGSGGDAPFEIQQKD